MLIVLDRPLAEAKEPVDDPAAFTREMTRLLSVLPLLCLFAVFGCLIHVAFSLAVWGGPFSLCFVSAISPGGAVDPR